MHSKRNSLCVLCVCAISVSVIICVCTVNHGNYIQAVLDRNLAENITRVLYPNDNVRAYIHVYSAVVYCESTMYIHVHVP